MAKGESSRYSLDAGGWTLSITGESESLIARCGERRLFLIGGRQIACQEGLEVLALGTRASFVDKRPIREVLRETAGLGLPHVIPWGAGKWFFGRGRLLSELLATHKSPLFFLGDEGGRPGLWRYPGHFREGAQIGVRDLPGTDPLPFPHEVSKVGRMGFCAEINLNISTPWGSMMNALRDRYVKLNRFARLEPPLRFLRNQIAMQLRKRQSA
jgi:hypothetical protein